MKEVVLASGNEHKLVEIQARLGSRMKLKPQTAWGVSSVPETGTTFLENALIKARHCATATGLPALADDSGLSVAALGGAPGIYSARYAGDDATDSANTAKLLAAMAELQGHRRRASFHATLILCRSAADPDPIIAQGRWYGRITLEPSGGGGFGYDPVFMPDGEEVTAAGLAPEVKNRISHRGLALDALLEQLDEWL